MSLQYKFFQIPARDSGKEAAEINRFLKTVRMVNIHREFVAHGENLLSFQAGQKPEAVPV